MQKGFWERVRFYCMNHDKPLEMSAYQGATSAYYACAKRFPWTEEFKQGYRQGERQCLNSLSFDTAYKIVEKLAKVIEEADMQGRYVDFQNFRLTYLNTDIKVLQYTPDLIKVGVLNRQVKGV